MKASQNIAIWLLTVLFSLAVPIAVFATESALNQSVTAEAGVSPEQLERNMVVGERQIVQITEKETYTITSDKEEILEVEGQTLSAKQAGTAVLTIQDAGKTVEISMTVREAATAIQLPKNFKLEEGTSKVLRADVMPKEAAGVQLTWSSSNERVATVQNGLVKAVGTGTAIISAQAKNGITGTVQVKVFRIEPTEIAVNKKSFLIELVETDQLEAKAIPEDATDPTVTLEVTDSAIAEIASDGTISPKAEGKTTIVATTSNGLKKEIPLEVFVVGAESIELIVPEADLKKTEQGYRAKPETVLSVSAKVHPKNATYPELTWESSNPEVAVVVDGTIEFVEPGTATIRCSTVDGIQQEIYFEVYDATGTIMAITIASALLLLLFYILYNRNKRYKRALRQKVQEEELMPTLQNSLEPDFSGTSREQLDQQEPDNDRDKKEE